MNRSNQSRATSEDHFRNVESVSDAVFEALAARSHPEVLARSRKGLEQEQDAGRSNTEAVVYIQGAKKTRSDRKDALPQLRPHEELVPTQGLSSTSSSKSRLEGQMQNLLEAPSKFSLADNSWAIVVLGFLPITIYSLTDARVFFLFVYISFITFSWIYTQRALNIFFGRRKRSGSKAN